MAWFRFLGCLIPVLVASMPNASGQQQVYFTTNSILWSADIETCVQTKIGDLGHHSYDIAMNAAGEMYSVSSNDVLYKIRDLKTAENVRIGSLGRDCNALVFSKTGILYGASSSGLFTIDVTTGKATLIGPIVADGKRYVSEGDLTFYEDRLYLAATGNNLIEVNSNDPGKSRLVYKMNASTRFLGIVTIGALDCKGSRPAMFALGGEKLYSLDTRNFSTVLKCSFDLPAVIGGATSAAETSSFRIPSAGRDSVLTVSCATDQVMLSSLLRNHEPNGVWKTVANAAIISEPVLTTRNLANGSYHFQYIVGNNLCADTALITLKMSVAPYKYAGPTTAACADQMELRADADSNWDSFQWILPDGQVRKGNSVMVHQTGIVKILASSSASGCKSEDSITVTLSATPPPPSISPEFVFCEGESMPDISPGGNDIRWYADSLLTQRVGAGPDFEADVRRRGAGSWLYYVTQTSGEGCTSKAAIVKITVRSRPGLRLQAATVYGCIAESGAVTLHAQPEPGVFIKWFDQKKEMLGQSDSISVALYGRYYAYALNADQCVRTDSVEVKNDCRAKLTIPDVFTPNGDGINDVFQILGTGASNLDLTIYNRWGKVIYHQSARDLSELSTKFWDGQVGAGSAGNGVFAWKLQYDSNHHQNRITRYGKILVAGR